MAYNKKQNLSSLNRKSRRMMARKVKTEKTEDQLTKKDKLRLEDVQDKNKIFHKKSFEAVREHVQRLKQHFDLPKEVPLERRPERSSILVINKDGRQRELLPDIPGEHRILCHRSLAKVFTSELCIFARITDSQDGSWAICPASADMSNRTTIQIVRRRPFWFLRRYGYEISFDGRIQPAMLFQNYGLNPERKSMKFTVTHEVIKVKDTEEYNDYYRIWLKAPK